MGYPGDETPTTTVAGEIGVGFVELDHVGALEEESEGGGEEGNKDERSEEELHGFVCDAVVMRL